MLHVAFKVAYFGRPIPEGQIAPASQADGEEYLYVAANPERDDSLYTQGEPYSHERVVPALGDGRPPNVQIEAAYHDCRMSCHAWQPHVANGLSLHYQRT